MFGKIMMSGMLALPFSAMVVSPAQAAGEDSARVEQNTSSYQKAQESYAGHPFVIAKTCANLQKTYPYGIKLTGAKDKVPTGYSPVTNPKQVTTSVYNTYKSLDADKDKMVCERPKYKNCAKLNSLYAHGIGLKGAKDKATKPVTNFTVIHSAIYWTNTHLDRDSDRISCEKK